MSTPVTVTKPTIRGSFADEARNVAISSRTASATRSARRLLRRCGRLERSRDLLLAIALDDVAHLDVVEVLDADTALETFAHFLHIVLEAAQRADGTFVNLGTVANDARTCLAI